ncbi:MAG: hypothetical protein RLZZ440_1316 [Planctomycetota bacterium]
MPAWHATMLTQPVITNASDRISPATLIGAVGRPAASLPPGPGQRRTAARWVAWAAMSLTTFLASVAYGQPDYHEYTLSTDIGFVSSLGPQNGESFTVPATASTSFETLYSNMLGAGNTLAWSRDPSQPSSQNYTDINWMNSGYGAWEHLRFRSADSTTRPAYMAGYVASGADFNYEGLGGQKPQLTVRAVELDGVTLTPMNVQTQLEAASGSVTFTLNNGGFDVSNSPSLLTPTFISTTPLTVAATGTSNVLHSWTGVIAAPTTLSVASGTALQLVRCGDIGNLSTASAQLRWSSVDNAFDINGGSLDLSFSGMLFYSDPVPTVTGGVVTAGLVVRNGGSLQISGRDDTESYSKLTMHGGLLIDNSTVTLGPSNRIEFASGQLHLANATVQVASGGRVTNENDATVVSGTSTINVVNDEQGFTAADLRVADSSSKLVVQGGGVAAVRSLFLDGGQVDVATDSTLVLAPYNNQPTNFTPGGTISLAATATLDIPRLVSFSMDNNGTVTPIQTAANSTIVVAGDFIGKGDIGDGILFVTDGGLLAHAGLTSSTLEVGELIMKFDAVTEASLDPTALTSDTVVCDDLTLEAIFPSIAPTLTLAVDNDTPLPLGTKFTLFDYVTANTVGAFYFKDRAPGSTFTLGLNDYQIDYQDASLGGTAITLTVVPEPLAAASIGLGLAFSLVVRQRQRRLRRAGHSSAAVLGTCRTSSPAGTRQPTAERSAS